MRALDFIVTTLYTVFDVSFPFFHTNSSKLKTTFYCLLVNFNAFVH